jgi:hypothetical protein
MIQPLERNLKNKRIIVQFDKTIIPKVQPALKLTQVPTINEYSTSPLPHKIPLEPYALYRYQLITFPPFYHPTNKINVIYNSSR